MARNKSPPHRECRCVVAQAPVQKMVDIDIEFRLAKRETLVPYRRSAAPGGMELIADVSTVLNRPLTQADTHFYRVASCSFTSNAEPPGVFVIFAAGNALAYDQIGWCLQQYGPFREWVHGLLRRPSYPPHVRIGSPVSPPRPGTAERVGSPETSVSTATLSLSPVTRTELTPHTVVENGAVHVACIILHAIHAFGPLRDDRAPPTEGMVHAEAVCTGVFPGQRYGDGYRVPGVTFVRNPVSFVLPIVQTLETERMYAVVVGQYRLADATPGVAVGYIEGVEPRDAEVYGGNEVHDAHLTFELPAGQIDSKGDFKAKAMDELREETGLAIALEKTHCLNPGMACHFSIGGCTEKAYGYYTHEIMQLEKMRALANGGTRGVGADEKTVVRFVPLHRLAEFTGDAKAHFALSRLAIVRPDLMAKVRAQEPRDPMCTGKGVENGFRGWLKWFGLTWVGGNKDAEV